MNYDPLSTFSFVVAEPSSGFSALNLPSLSYIYFYDLSFYNASLLILVLQHLLLLSRIACISGAWP